MEDVEAVVFLSDDDEVEEASKWVAKQARKTSGLRCAAHLVGLLRVARALGHNCDSPLLLSRAVSVWRARHGCGRARPWCRSKYYSP